MTMPSEFHSQPLSTILLLLVLLSTASHMILEAVAAEQDEQQPITLRGCPDKCGNISIPYPFGMKPGCFREGFQVTCNDSFNPHRAYLAYDGVFQRVNEIYFRAQKGLCQRNRVWNRTREDTALELIDISVAKGEARAYAAISSRCSANHTDSLSKSLRMRLGEKMSPFVVSVTRNVLIGVGWRVQPKMNSYLWSALASDAVSAHGYSSNELTISCLSYLMRMPQFLKFATNGSCSGRGCCRAALPEGQHPPPDYACVSGNSSCSNATSGLGYVCKCWDHYDGNPYIANGCQDIDECKLRDLYPCSSDGICKNTLGGYACPCKSGMKGDGVKGTCTHIFPQAARTILVYVFSVVAFSGPSVSSYKTT